jgi:hypothetical protein
MSTAFRVIVSLILGAVVGVLIVLGLCSIPALTFSAACGHNAGMWFFATVPLAILACWLTLPALARHNRDREGRSIGGGAPVS